MLLWNKDIAKVWCDKSPFIDTFPYLITLFLCFDTMEVGKANLSIKNVLYRSSDPFHDHLLYLSRFNSLDFGVNVQNFAFHVGQ